jgi:hypothetical protein
MGNDSGCRRGGWARRLGRVGKTLVLALLLVSAEVPVVGAEADLSPNNGAIGHTSPVVDALFLRPMGLIATLTGAVIFIAATPIFVLTRPTQIAEPFRALVLAPARYTWVDPLGDHAPKPD